eukprot:9967621-Karenia_brevis.AAC.1
MKAAVAEQEMMVTHQWMLQVPAANRGSRAQTCQQETYQQQQQQEEQEQETGKASGVTLQ